MNPLRPHNINSFDCWCEPIVVAGKVQRVFVHQDDEQPIPAWVLEQAQIIADVGA